MPLQRRPPLLIVGASSLSLALTALTALSLWEIRVDALARARDAPAIVALPQNIRAAVLAAGEPNKGSAHGKLTVSIGVAMHPGVVTADDTPQDLVRLADGRLYEAKAAGRNTVIPRQERSKLAVV